jgi:uncharacterized protein YydD (DUF2326 family)
MKHLTSRRSYALIAICGLIIACGGATNAASGLPDSPDGTITYVAQQVADGNAGVVWDAMPATWQTDVNDLTHEFANKMDAELWNKVFAVAQKAVTVLQDKKDLILSTSMMDSAGENKDDIVANWDTVTTALSTLVNSEISDIENLKTMDWGAFADGSGGQLVKQMMVLSASQKDGDEINPEEALRSISAEVLENDGQVAKLKVTMEGEEPEEIEMAKVEGRWVPKDMADEWDEKIAEAREGLANMSEEEMQQQKMQVMMGLGMAEAMIDQVAMAETPEQLEQMMAVTDETNPHPPP